MVGLFQVSTGKIPAANNKAFGFGIDPINDFTDSIISGEKFMANAVDGLEATKIADAVHESIITGKPVKLER